MRILFDKALSENYTAISSTTGSINYAPANIFDNFLYKRYQPSTGSSDTITITLPGAGVSVNSIWWGYWTGTSMSIALRFSSSTLETVAVSSGTDAYGVSYLSQTRVIDEIVITFNGTYLGGLEGGLYTQMPSGFVPQYLDSWVDNSRYTSSAYGQVQQQNIPPLDRFRFTFTDMDTTTFDALKLLLKAAGIGGHIWVDIFEGDTGDEPYYAIISRSPSPQRSDLLYNLALELTEAR